jgi:signal transduction histidine kinase
MATGWAFSPGAGESLGREIAKMTKALAGLSEDFAHRTNAIVVLACGLLATGIFLLDVASLPLGVAAGVAYVAVVLLSLWLPRWQYTFFVAGCVSVLTVLGYYLSEPNGIPWMAVANRLLALAAIWLTAVSGAWLVDARRKKAEDALRLQTTFRIESEKAMREAEREVVRARSAKSRFLESASNNLRHHLQTLSLLNGALCRIVNAPEGQDMLAMERDALDHLRDLLDSLLEICRLEAGEIELEFAETPMPEILRRLHDEFEDQAQAKGLKLQIDPRSEIAYSDRELLTQVIRMMVSNAIRYTNQGTVNVYCQREADSLRVTVEDSGIGIAPDQLTGIFEEFYRVDNDPAGRNGSLGLGLSIVERSAKLLGATVEVESELGHGSRFSLLVPAGSAAEVQSAGHAG